VFEVKTGVLHGTINPNGSWFTGTFEGPVVGPTSGFSGHGATWFGDENNLRPQLDIMPATGNITGSLPGGPNLEAHFNVQLVFNTTGNMHMDHYNFHCA
jgi:hypothetical protein